MPDIPEKPRDLKDMVEVSDERREVSSMLELDPDTMEPGMSYKFVREDRMRIARHKMRGYRVVLMSESTVRPYVEFDDSGDGAIRVGDTILMQCPTEKVERRKKQEEQVTTRRLNAPKKAVQDKAKRAGIRTIQDRE